MSCAVALLYSTCVFSFVFVFGFGAVCVHIADNTALHSPYRSRYCPQTRRGHLHNYWTKYGQSLLSILLLYVLYIMGYSLPHTTHGIYTFRLHINTTYILAPFYAQVLTHSFTHWVTHLLALIQTKTSGWVIDRSVVSLGDRDPAVHVLCNLY